ncbi:MAG TPA: hypothetical protein VH143_12780 [Kofleriaceae bacterium]|jgi:hypothetical protein|nr:hypothetical protein [Kofleriaceae bacterium]
MKLALGATVVSLAACQQTRAIAPTGDIGVAAPTAGLMAPDDGRWFVLCQARRDTDGDGRLSIKFGLHDNDGDRATPFLVLRSGAGEAIDYPAAHTPDGSWLAIVRGGKLELIDSTTLARTTLDADLRNDGEWLRRKNTRAISFADDSSRAVYIKPDNTIVIRELASGTERAIAMTELVWRATIDAAGAWAEVKTIPADTDHDGVISWPGGFRADSLTDCDVDILHQARPEPKDAVKTRWLELATGKLVDDPTIIGTVGGKLLRRTPDGALVLGGEQITDPACHAHVVGTIDNPAAPRAIVTCGATAAEHTTLVVAGPGVHVVTRADAYVSLYDMVSPYDTLPLNDRFKHLDDTTYVDLADGSEIKLPGTHVAGALSRFILIDTGRELAAFDLEQRVAKPLGTHGAIDPNSLGEQVTIDGEVYDLRTAKRIAKATDDIAFISDTGRVLHFAKPSERGYAPFGPLRWDP